MVAVEDDVGGTGRGSGKIAEPARAELQGQVERFRTMTAPGPFGFVGDVPGAALDTCLGFLVVQIGRLGFSLFTWLLGGLQHPLQIALQLQGSCAELATGVREEKAGAGHVAS